MVDEIGPGSGDDERKRLGRTGEEAALDRYLRAGYREVCRNWRCAIGEIDLVLSRGDLLVLCEVKTRRGDALGAPYEAVTWRKRRKLARLADAFLTEWHGRAPQVRFDVASVSIDRERRATMHIYEDAF